MKRIRRALTHITAGSVRKASVTYFLKTEIRVQKVRLHLALSRNLSGTEWGYLWSFPSGQEFPFGCWDSESWAQTWIEWTWRPRWLSGWFTEITAGLVWTGHFDHPLVSGPSESSLMLSHSYFRLRATFPTQKRSNTCRLRGQVAPSHPSPSTEAAPCESLLKDGDPSRGQGSLAGWCHRTEGMANIFPFFPLWHGRGIPKKWGSRSLQQLLRMGGLAETSDKACKKNKQTQTLNSVIFCDYIYLRMIVYMHIYRIIYIYI